MMAFLNALRCWLTQPYQPVPHHPASEAHSAGPSIAHSLR